MRVARLSSYFPAIALLLALPGQAAEWSVTPSVSLKSGYNDNIRLTTADHDSVWETNLSPSINFGVAKEHQGLTGDARVLIRRFSGGNGRESSSLLDREDYFFNTDAFHRTPLNTFRGRVEYSRISTLDSENDPSGEVIQQQATRETIAFSPSWQKTINERTQLNLNASYTDVSFSDDPGIQDLVEYNSYSVSSLLVRQFTPRILGTLSAGYSVFQPETGFDSKTLSLQAGISGNISETLVASFLAGQRDTTSDTVIGSGFCIGADPGASFPSCTGGIPIPTGTVDDEINTSGSVFSADITKTLETGTLNATITRSTNPSNQGELLDTTRLILTGTHNFTKNLSSSLKIEFNERETIVNRLGRESDQENRTTFRIKPKVSWRWRREWEIAGEYQYAENEDEFSRTARRNALYLTLNYVPVKMSISR